MARRRIRVSRRSQANRLQLKKTSDFCSSPKVKREARQPPSISIVFVLGSARLSRWKRGRRQREAIVSWWKGDGAARAHLAELAMPVLVGNGIADVMVPAEHSFAIARNAPRAKLILYPDAGHAFLFQYAEDFSDEVLKFLSENEILNKSHDEDRDPGRLSECRL